MSHKIKTAAPDEVKGVLDLLAELMDTYADDQLASQRRGNSIQFKRECSIRADVYRDLAQEFREIIVTQGGGDVEA